MAIENINKSVKIIDKDTLRITKRFAENNLSKECLKYAELVTDEYYFWSFEDYAYAVIFEIPKIFEMDYMFIVQMLSTYCGDYIKDKKLCFDILMTTFNKNYSRKIVY